MIRIGYAPGAFDFFHIGHLNLLRRAKNQCDYLIAGVVSDDVLIAHKGITPVVPLAERLEIVRNVRFVDAVFPATTSDKLEFWSRSAARRARHRLPAARLASAPGDPRWSDPFLRGCGSSHWRRQGNSRGRLRLRGQ
jgi:cytidyltransferase-like protein